MTVLCTCSTTTVSSFRNHQTRSKCASVKCIWLRSRCTICNLSRRHCCSDALAPAAIVANTPYIHLPTLHTSKVNLSKLNITKNVSPQPHAFARSYRRQAYRSSEQRRPACRLDGTDRDPAPTRLFVFQIIDSACIV